VSEEREKERAALPVRPERRRLSDTPAVFFDESS
jgi:hypothetical protein